MSIDDFINTYNGQTNVGDTPGNNGQCVGLVEKWLDTIGAPHIWGNACDLPKNADPSAYVVTANSATYIPAVGDIGCFPAGWGGSSVGHTFIVCHGTDQNYLHVFEQNDHLGGGTGNCRLWTLPYDPNMVFVHPKVLDAPAPPPQPVESSFTWTDQTSVPVGVDSHGYTWGNLELQAVRSTLGDQRTTIARMQQDVIDSGATIAQLKRQIANPPDTSPSSPPLEPQSPIPAPPPGLVQQLINWLTGR